ncbi:MAG: DUF2339 domain-containing protein [Deltaproteobacteria bacterium]
MTDPENPWKQRAPLLGLVPLALILLGVMVWAPWHSNFDVDTMTHFEQVRSIADHGSIGFENGPIESSPELRTRWFVAAHGRAWGILPAVMPYLLAPAMRVGGFPGAIRMIWLIFGLGAVMVYALVARLTRRPWLGVAASYTLVLGTSLGFWATMIAPFVPAACIGIAAVYVASRALDARTSRGEFAMSSAAGAVSAAALGSHLLWTFPWAGLGAVMTLTAGSLATRARRAAGYGLGSLPLLALMGWVNHQRFGTWNPVSYGPCNAHSCTDPNNNQTALAFLGTIAPALPYAAAFALVLWLSRGSRRALTVASFVGACGALIPETPTRERLALLLRTTYGYVFDVGNLNIQYGHAADGGPGSFNNGWCVRSLLQCTPVIAAAALAGFGARSLPQRHRGTLQLLAAVCLGVLFGCTLRADTGGAYVYGFPFLNIRYIALLVPAALVLAAASMQGLPWRPWHAVVAIGVAGIGAWFLAGRPHGDDDLLRRQLTHWGTVGLAVALFAVAAAWAHLRDGRGPRVVALFAALAVGCGGAITLGIDTVAARDYRGAQDSRTRELARCAPEARMILLGGYAMDEALALHDRRDILIVNVGMGPRDGMHARQLVLDAMRPDRPAYLIEDDASGRWSSQFRWPGLTFQRIPGCPRVRKVVRTAG